MPMRRFLWEDYIYSTKAQKNPKVSLYFFPSIQFGKKKLPQLATLNFNLSNPIIAKEIEKSVTYPKVWKFENFSATYA